MTMYDNSAFAADSHSDSHRSDSPRDGLPRFTGDLNEDAASSSGSDYSYGDRSSHSSASPTPATAPRPVIPKLSFGGTMGTPAPATKPPDQTSTAPSTRKLNLSPHLPLPPPKSESSGGIGSKPGTPMAALPPGIVPSLSLGSRGGSLKSTPAAVPMTSPSSSDGSAAGGFTGDLNEDVERLEAMEKSDSDSESLLSSTGSSLMTPKPAHTPPVVPKLGLNLSALKTPTVGVAVSPGGAPAASMSAPTLLSSTTTHALSSSKPVAPTSISVAAAAAAAAVLPASRVPPVARADATHTKMHQLEGERRAALTHKALMGAASGGGGGGGGGDGGGTGGAAAAVAGMDAASMELLYAKGRKFKPLYSDSDLHLAILELILALMVDPRGDLETLYCAQFPIEQRKHNVPFLLYLHLNHTHNAALVPELHQRCRRLGAGAVRLLKLCCRALFNPELYRQRERVARGAFAQVFRCTLPAMSEASPRTVALKLVDLPQSIHDPCAAYDLYSELTILERLRMEPGMCQMLDFGVDDECFYVVLKDYRCSLRAWREGYQGDVNASLPLLLNVYQQVLDVCEHMTELGLVHYDIKGDNVLIQPLPGVSDTELFNPSSATPPFTCVMADFGESKLFHAEVAAFSARNRGTEYIKSPEMLTVSSALQKSRATYDRRKHQGAGRPSDVWSVGCMLYELVTSQFLFYDPDWIRFFVRLTQPEQQLLPDERMAQVDGLAVVREFTEYTLVRALPSVNKRWHRSAPGSFPSVSLYLLGSFARFTLDAIHACAS
jgi:hypothetical protein